MIVKQVVQVGDPVIRAKAKKVIRITASTQSIIRNLIDSMRYHDLVGMAAPQIGKGVRIFVTEIRKTKLRRNLNNLDALRIFINPVITQFSKKNAVGYEGCGSVAQARLFAKVRRPTRIRVTAMDAKGKLFTLSAVGLPARVVQHELDHLNGVVFVDHLTTPKTLIDRKTFLQLKRSHLQAK